MPTPAPAQMLWVANYWGEAVLSFNIPGVLLMASPAPHTDIGGSNSQLMTYRPQCAQVDSGGNLYVVGTQGSRSPGAIMYYPGAARLVGYASIIPAATVAGGNTLLTNPVGCAFDTAGNLWVANDDDFTDSVVMFSNSELTTGGNVSPSRIIHPVQCCGNASLCNTISLTFDPGGNLWTGSLCAPAAKFSATSISSTGSPMPITWFGQSAGVNSLAFDSSGNLWTAIGTSVTEFDAATLAFGVPGSLTAHITISGTNTQISDAYGLAFDNSGNLWVSDINNNTLLMFAKASLSTGGNIAPSAVISAASSLVEGPSNIGIFNASMLPSARTH